MTRAYSALLTASAAIRPGQGGDKGDAQQILVEKGVFGHQAMIDDEMAMIGHEDDHGVFQNAALFQQVKNVPDLWSRKLTIP